VIIKNGYFSFISTASSPVARQKESLEVKDRGGKKRCGFYFVEMTIYKSATKRNDKKKAEGPYRRNVKYRTHFNLG
jgi:hypothetical protein